MSELVPAMQWDNGKYQFQRKLGNFVQYFQVNLPTNSYGVPLQLINPVVIAENTLDCETTDDVPDLVLDAAIINIDFDDGIPVVDGLPLWERFDGESLDYYKYFKEYREMAYIKGSRAISKLAEQFKLEGRVLNALAKVYHWQLRCRAYDAYKKTVRERKRQLEIQEMESKHTQASKTLLEAGLSYIEAHPEQLNPKVALQMIQVAMKAGRLSLGLNAEKPGTGDSAPSIAIHQTTNTGTSGEVSVSSEVNSGAKGDQVDTSYLQSIVHILDKSGALDQAKQNVIDAEYTEVDDHDAAVEGT